MCPRCGASVETDPRRCEACGQPFVTEPALPIAGRGWTWFGSRWRSASSLLRVPLAGLFACAAYVYLLLGPLVFDAGYWISGKLGRLRADRRWRAGISVALVVVYFLAIASVSGSSHKSTAPGSSASAEAVAAAESARSATPGSAALATVRASESGVAPASSASASPRASTADVDDEAAGSAGPSFVAAATGIVPPSHTAVARLPGEPDPTLTPGALNPAVTQASIHSTICVSGWTATIRPPESVTGPLKVEQIGEYGYADTKTSDYEEDHLISLELGGAPADPRNLWPEPYTASLADGRPTGAHTKDGFETRLKTEVCAGTITLAVAQSEIGDHWVHAYYGIPIPDSSASPATAPIATVAAATPLAAATEPPAVTEPPTTPKPTPTDPYAAAKATGATAVCHDGTLSFSPVRSGTCSGHGGVHWWTGNVGAEGPGDH